MNRILSFFLLAMLALRADAEETLKLVQTIPLPGVQGRFDHFAIDLKGRRLFVAALGNNTLEVIDVAAGKSLQSISGLHKPTGVLYLQEQNRVCVANGGDGSLRLFDGNPLRPAGTIGGFDDADNLRFDSKTGLIYLGYGDGALAVIDSKNKQKVGDIKLRGHPESFQLENGGGRIFVNVPDGKEISVVDREKRETVATWRFEKFEGNFPMALDEANHLLFAGCRRPVPWLF